jgi:hypothetical protein
MELASCSGGGGSIAHPKSLGSPFRALISISKGSALGSPTNLGGDASVGASSLSTKKRGSRARSGWPIATSEALGDLGDRFETSKDLVEMDRRLGRACGTFDRPKDALTRTCRRRSEASKDRSCRLGAVTRAPKDLGTKTRETERTEGREGINRSADRLNEAETTTTTPHRDVRSSWDRSIIARERREPSRRKSPSASFPRLALSNDHVILTNQHAPGCDESC